MSYRRALPVGTEALGFSLRSKALASAQRNRCPSHGVMKLVIPRGLPPIPVPPDNPPTAGTVALGRRLFYEKRLSADDSVACASCHDPLRAFSDGNRQSRGAGGRTGTRNAPTVLNAAFSPRQFWDGRADSLEEQAGGPIANPLEKYVAQTRVIRESPWSRGGGK